MNAGVDGETYLGSKFCLTLPSVEYIAHKVKQLGKESLLYKIDISRALCHVPIDPGDYNLLGLHFISYFINKSLPFGYRHLSAIVQCLSDTIRYIMMKKGFHVTNYIDDIISQASPSQAEDSFSTLDELLRDLGLDLSQKKLIYPTTRVLCLGVIIDTESFTISVPEDKLYDIRHTSMQWQDKTSCSKKELQALLGKLLYITKCVQASRPFHNRMLQLLHQADKQQITRSEDFARNWFMKFLPKFNGAAFFFHSRVLSHIELDVSVLSM